MEVKNWSQVYSQMRHEKKILSKKVNLYRTMCALEAVMIIFLFVLEVVR